ncbi:helix-turn-helix domain-containing protein [Novosphingobium sp. PASSN1]|uniref:helix-turn-helix domain-containing protein n=1 Tax=Novosphingobium sp. PASSN1 TaxID=2015561 RepID=UPI0025DEAB3A|nr:helix-turn-helix domain-containing protein [Novosphingobium sp. PASSN1]
MHDPYRSNAQIIRDLSNVFTVEGQILLLLLDGEKHAGILYKYIKASQPTISRTLSTLSLARHITSRSDPKDGRSKFYKISPEKGKIFLESINNILIGDL